MREMEESLPESERLITREYNDLYGGDPSKPKQLGVTTHERRLTRFLSALYVVFILGALWTLVVQVVS